MGTIFVTTIIAAIFSCLFGGVYYRALSRQWIVAAGLTESELSPAPWLFLNTFISNIILSLFQIFAAIYIVDIPFGGLLVSLGLAIAILLTMNVNHRYQNASVKLPLIDGGHWFGVLIIQSIMIQVALEFL